MNHLNTHLTLIMVQIEKMEARVYSKLCDIEKMKNQKAIAIEEGKLMSMLIRLDHLQDELDAANAEIRAAGLNTVISYAGNVYRYKPRKLKSAPKPKPKPKPTHREHGDKVYPIESPTPAKLKAKKAGLKVAEMEAREKERAERRKVREAEKLAAQEARERRAAARQAKEDAKLATEEERQAARLLREQQEAEKLAARLERQAARKAGKPTSKPKNVRPPKAKPTPKPRKPRESQELKLAKKRRDAIQTRLDNLDDQIEREHAALLVRLEERKARVHKVRNLPPEQNGNQRRADARKGLENVEAQLAGLGQRKQDRWQSLTEQLEKANQEVATIAANENASQVLV